MVLPFPGDGKQTTLHIIVTTDVWTTLQQQYDQKGEHLEALDIAIMIGEIRSNNIHDDERKDSKRQSQFSIIRVYHASTHGTNEMDAMLKMTQWIVNEDPDQLH